MHVLIECQCCRGFIEHDVSAEEGKFFCLKCGAENTLEHPYREGTFNEYLEKKLRKVILPHSSGV